MIHARSLAEIAPGPPSLLTIGSFDGVHLGHQSLVRRLADAAHGRRPGWRAVVITFFPHPAAVLHGRRPAFYLNTPDEKADLFAGLGADVTVTHPFTLDVSRITAAEFVEQLLAACQFRELWCGPDFAFGHNRQGTVSWLTDYGSRRGFEVRIVEPLTLDGQPISSSRIRQALAGGDVALAAACLGRPFQLSGTVVVGSRRGHTIGIPTANLQIWEERAVPARGVYACRAWLGDRPVNAVTNIGVRPTFEADTQPTVETHLLDFEGDLYGQTIRLDFLRRLRPEQKFGSVDELVAQVRRDIDSARTILSRELRIPG